MILITQDIQLNLKIITTSENFTKALLPGLESSKRSNDRIFVGVFTSS
jgi:hypothetical protein